MISNFHLSLLIVLGLLTCATGLAEVLARLKPESKTLKNIKIIVKSWWIIVAVVTGSLALGKHVLLALFLLLSLVVVNEYLKQSHYGRDKRPVLFIVLSFTVLLQYGAIFYGADQLFFIIIPLLILIVAPLIIIFTNSISNLPSAFGAISGLMLLIYYLSYIPALAFSKKIHWSVPDQALTAVLILIFFTEVNDIFQFISGKLFGKRKIVPQVSPNKTEMGFIGGLLCTTLAMTFAGPPLLQISKSQSALLGFSISFFGIMGDLFFSAVKRHLAIKDFGRALPGHGGFIDRIDSLIFTSPIFFHLLTYLKGNS